jgi:DNA-binding NtrC family response regulator
MKEQLEKLVLQMCRSGMTYSEAITEFQKAFIVAVLRDQNGNQVKAAGRLGIHRNTLRRNLQEFDVNIKVLRVSRRRPPVSASPIDKVPRKAAAAK